MRALGVALSLLAAPLLVARTAGAEPPGERLGLGARAGRQLLFLEGDGSPSDLQGFVVGLDATYRASTELGLAAALEASIYPWRSDRLGPGSPATSYAFFLEARLDTNPAGPLSVRIDVGPGVRSLFLPRADGGVDGFAGVEPLRLHVGPELRVGGKTTLAIVGGFGFGWFSAHPGARQCAVTATCADSLFNSDTQSSTHFVVDLSFVVGVWP